jgi:hypothetical protein
MHEIDHACIASLYVHMMYGMGMPWQNPMAYGASRAWMGDGQMNVAVSCDPGQESVGFLIHNHDIVID